MLIAFVGLTCCYSIQAGEIGVVQRFGKFVRCATPGLNFKMPAGIESVKRVPDQYIATENSACALYPACAPSMPRTSSLSTRR